jgi:CRISPR-associated protein Cas2
MKTCRKYLTHVQKSVFEGDLTEGKTVLLRKELEAAVDMEQDFVIMYTLPDGRILNRDIVTNTPDPTDNFI